MRKVIRTTCVSVAVLAAMGLAAKAQYAASASLPSASSQLGSARPWWKQAVVYEIYPRSFADSNGDGVGDLNGITEHLDYLEQLGVDAIWLAPIYPSPQVDFGYGISDYTAIDPQYGTLADFDRLVVEAKKRNLRLVVDMVLNHTSDKSVWFIESASSKTNSKTDWYVWNDGTSARNTDLSEIQKKNVQIGSHGEVVPPNNWLSVFGGSAWAWVPARQQFYYHKFYAEQPDLNWRNPDVEKAMFAVMRFWLDRGVSGFRLDAIQTLFEDRKLRNDPNAANPMATGYTSMLPDVHDVLKRVRSLLDSYPGDRVLIGELIEPSVSGLDVWYGGEAHNELQLPMDYSYGFPSLFAANRSRGKDTLDAGYYRRQLVELSTRLHGSEPFIFFNNHDNARSIDRFADGQHDIAIAKTIAALLLTSPATAQTYYGEELGMVTTTPTRREDVRDPVGRAAWPVDKGRDGERTPMQWTAGSQAGFSTNPNTWLPVPLSSASTNAAVEQGDPNSLLNWYRALIALRRSNPAMLDGGIVMVDANNADVLAFTRTAPRARYPILVLMNMTAIVQTIAIDPKKSGVASGLPHTLLATPGMVAPPQIGSVDLPPYAVWIAELR